MYIEEFIDSATILVQRKDYNPKPNMDGVEKVSGVELDLGGSKVHIKEATIGNPYSSKYEYDFIDEDDEHLNYLVSRAYEKAEPFRPYCFDEDWQKDYIISDVQIVNPTRDLQGLFRSVCESSEIVDIHVNTVERKDIHSVDRLESMLTEKGLL